LVAGQIVKNFFVSYNGKDKAWAEWIAYQLEEAGYSTVIQAWDFQAGGNFVLEMQKATAEAERTIAVLSQNYLDAEYTHPEWAAAFAKDPQGKERTLVPVRIAECQLDGLFLPIVYIDLVGTNEQTAKEALLNRIKNERAKPTQPPVFPGQPSTTSKPKPDFPGITPSERPWKVPHQRNLFFTGREKVLEKLHQAIAAGKTTALAQPQAISGLGGIGKTQTAVEYAYRYRDEYTAVLWTKTETRETLISDFVAIAQLLDLPQKDAQEQSVIVAAVKRWLENNPNWLLILDNADDLTIAREFLPSSKKGHILLTTRARNTGALADRIEIEDMAPEEGALFLLRRAQIIAKDASLEAAPIKEQETAKAISKELGGLPLALDQAGAFILETPSSLDEYLALYKQEGAKLIAQRGDLPPDDHVSVTVTFSLAFQKLEERSRAAADMIRVCTFLAPDAIPEEIFTEGGKELGENLAPLASKPIDFLDALKEAGRFSLIDRNAATRTLDIHRLVQKVVKERLDDETQRLWTERIIRALELTLPDVKFATWTRCERLIPHVQSCAQFVEEHSLALPEIAPLLNLAGNYLHGRGRFNEIEPLYRSALTIVEQVFGSEHITIAISLNNLAVLYQAQGRYNEAEPLYSRALMITKQKLGTRHPEVATNLNNFAALYCAQHKYTEAERLYHQALEIWETTSDSDPLNVVTCLSALADLYRLQQRYVEAKSLHQQAQTIGEQYLEPHHPEMAQVFNNFALLYDDQQQHAEAELLYLQALKIKKATLGPEHPSIATSLNNLAACYSAQGKFAQAEALYKEALTIANKALGPLHPHVVTILLHLGDLFSHTQAVNKQAIAESFYTQALNIQEKILTPEDSELQDTLIKLEALHINQGKYTQAEPFSKRILEIREKKLGPDHPDVATCILQLALLYSKLKNYKQAELLYKRALKIREEVLGKNDLTVASVLEHYAALLQKTKRKGKAIKLSVRAKAIRDESVQGNKNSIEL
jgi:tetratricopeptide (TPR) repeat protein